MYGVYQKGIHVWERIKIRNFQLGIILIIFLFPEHLTWVRRNMTASHFPGLCPLKALIRPHFHPSRARRGDRILDAGLGLGR